MKRYSVIEAFEIQGKGTVVVLDNSEATNNPIGNPLAVTICAVGSKEFEAVAYKEWLLRRAPKQNEMEAYLLKNVSKAVVPIGTTVIFNSTGAT